jgi:cytochrome c oxidase subunit 2
MLAGNALASEHVDGKALFDEKCASCHSIGGGDRIGPDLHDVATRRPHEWLTQFVTSPQALIDAGDPTATALLERYNNIVMPSLGLSTEQTEALLAHITRASAQATPPPATTPAAAQYDLPRAATPQSGVLTVFLVASAIMIGVFGWIALSTREPADVDVKKGYRLRRIWFVSLTAVLVLAIVGTMARVPYAEASTPPDRVVYVTARQFSFVFSEQPIQNVAELQQVPTLETLQVKAGERIEFRVTSLDVNHGFGLYSPDRQLLSQVQAMPDYVNRLFVDLPEPGQYPVLCLEYCAAGHHVMRSKIIVE